MNEAAEQHGRPGGFTSISDAPMQVEIERRRPVLTVRVGNTSHSVIEKSAGPGEFVLLLDGVECRGWRYVAGNEVYVRIGGRTFVVAPSGDESDGGGGGGRQHEARADMPGVVVAIHCSAGQTVRNGDKLVTIESMKLQTTLVASHEAMVERVHVSPDATFERGAVLVTFTKPAE